MSADIKTKKYGGFTGCIVTYYTITGLNRDHINTYDSGIQVLKKDVKPNEMTKYIQERYEEKM